MNRINAGLLLLTSLFFYGSTQGQSIDEGKKFFYYERYASAKNVFSKLNQANPADETAAYWLGQTELALQDNAGAKNLYHTTLMANPNSPLLIAGMGHIELIDGKAQDARLRFETAISLSKGKSAEVLNAVGFANIDTKLGDAAYAVEKLKQATTIKKMNDPDVYCNLGDAYRKIGDGGNAQRSYEAALAINPNYARASYRIGKLYQTQGANQQEIYMKYYDEAIAKDPAYAPVYYNLYDYYYNNDVIKSGQYLDKYIANSDDDPKNCYYRASMKFAQALFTDAIAEADKCIAANPSPYYKLYALKAYSYNKLGDSANAKALFEAYFQKNPDNVLSNDYITYANVLLKFPGNDSLAGTFVDKGLALDSVESNKVTLLKGLATYYEEKKQYKEAANWYNKILSVKKAPSKTDMYYAGFNYYRSGDFPTAITIFAKYIEKFPEDAFGYYMTGKSYWGIDSTMQQGLANPSFDKAIEVGAVDSVKYKAQLIGSYKYMVAYYANIKKDNAKAIEYCDKILALDPADAEALGNKEILGTVKKPTPPKTPAPPKTTTKPAPPKPASKQ